MSSLMESPPTTKNTDMIKDPSSSIEASFSLEENSHFNCNANQFQSSPSLPPINTHPPPFHEEEDRHFNSSLEPYSSLFPPPSVAINTSTSTDPVSGALVALNRLARERGFVIHEVPGDGDCLFNSIVYQLNDNSFNSTSMRKMLVTHLRENAFHYRGFVSSAVPANNSNVYNADTVAPDEYDGYIALMSDYEEQSQFRWERYLDRLSNGAWGDHIALQGISNMLKITIEILKIDTNDKEIVTTVYPSDGASNYVVNIGLILQFHYVGLDSVDSINVIEHVSSDNSVSSTNVVDSCNGNANNAPNPDDLNDEVIALGDEHNM